MGTINPHKTQLYTPDQTQSNFNQDKTPIRLNLQCKQFSIELRNAINENTNKKDHLSYGSNLFPSGFHRSDSDNSGWKIRTKSNLVERITDLRINIIRIGEKGYLNQSEFDV